MEQPLPSCDDKRIEFDDATTPNMRAETDEELGNQDIWKRKDCKLKEKPSSDATSVGSVGEDDSGHGGSCSLNLDEDSRFIEIPLPGLVVNETILDENNNSNDPTPIATHRMDTTRSVPAFCAICISGYESGIDIVWSSNRLCEHVFHQDCMEQWLMKLKTSEGPLCPCCRRDFLADPYDLVLAAGDGAEDRVTASDMEDDAARKHDNDESRRFQSSAMTDQVLELDRIEGQDTSDADFSETGQDGSDPSRRVEPAV